MARQLAQLHRIRRLSEQLRQSRYCSKLWSFVLLYSELIFFLLYNFRLSIPLLMVNKVEVDQRQARVTLRLDLVTRSVRSRKSRLVSCTYVMSSGVRPASTRFNCAGNYISTRLRAEVWLMNCECAGLVECRRQKSATTARVMSAV